MRQHITRTCPAELRAKPILHASQSDGMEVLVAILDRCDGNKVLHEFSRGEPVLRPLVDQHLTPEGHNAILKVSGVGASLHLSNCTSS